MLDYACRVCESRALEEVVEFRALARVTSDCKPFQPGGQIAICGVCGAVQKPGSAQWLDEIDQIYSGYEIYFQSAGAEQAVFDPSNGAPRPRSSALLQRVSGVCAIPEQGQLVDIGCGKGAFLSSFADFRPAWDLFGHELEQRTTGSLERIPRFKRLFTGPIDNLPGDFDAISLMHSLEHFTDPVGGLSTLREKLSRDGFILIEVPNARVTPFDLVVADHATHFSKRHLDLVMRRAGLGTITIADDWIVKELSGVADRNGEAGSELAASADVTDGRRRLGQYVSWLAEVVRSARRIAAAHRGKFGIFGTSIASMWLFGEIGEDTAFFVDEDPHRHGSLHGRPIFQPRDVPAGSLIYLALIPNVARAVADRLTNCAAELALPPEL
jgi:SAM-dependent methyltransferase